jgi:hypothetical protein
MIRRSGCSIHRDRALGIAGMPGSAAGVVGYRFPSAPRRVPIFNTGETKNPRMAAEDNSALRAKRLISQDRSSSATEPPRPEIFVALRGFSVSSVLETRSRTSRGPAPVPARPAIRSSRQNITSSLFMGMAMRFGHSPHAGFACHVVSSSQRFGLRHGGHAGAAPRDEPSHPLPVRSVS